MIEDKLRLNRVEELLERLETKLDGTDERPLYSVESLAERLGLSTRTVRQMLADKVIPSFKVLGARRVDPCEVDRYLAAQRAASGRPGDQEGS